jgi:hypothetical protein
MVLKVVHMDYDQASTTCSCWARFVSDNTLLLSLQAVAADTDYYGRAPQLFTELLAVRAGVLGCALLWLCGP